MHLRPTLLPFAFLCTLGLGVLGCGASFAIGVDEATEAWPDYRGPRADGQAPNAKVPLEWSETENVSWKTAIHGRGWSTPIVHRGKVWLTTATPEGHDMFVIALDSKSGKILVDKKLFHVEKPRPLGNTMNSYASPSPVAEGDYVYISFGSYGTACLEAKTAKTVWTREDLPCHHWRGPASSPILFENLLIFHMDGADHQYIVALDKSTGKTKWKVQRSTDYGDLDANGKPKRDGDFRKAYNTPIVVEHAGKPLLISPAAKAVYGYAPATGEEIWQVRYPGHSTASRTVFHEGVAFINTGYSKAELWAVKIDGQGDVTDSHVKWKRKRNVCNRPSPVLIDGLIYYVSDKGVGTCLDADSGEEVWMGRVGGNYSSSLLYANGHIFVFSMEGKTSILKPGRKLEIVATNDLDEGFMASPAVAGDSLLLRTRTHLYRIAAEK